MTYPHSALFTGRCVFCAGGQKTVENGGKLCYNVSAEMGAAVRRAEIGDHTGTGRGKDDTMYCTRKINDDYTWVGADCRRLAMFEGVYDVPQGISFNSYLLTDEKTVLFDTVDSAVRHTFRENLTHALAGRELDYVVVHHMERTTRRSWLTCCGTIPGRRCCAAPWPRP